MGPKVLLTPEAFMRPTGGIRRYALELEKAIATFGESERIGEGIGLAAGRIAGRRVGGSLARLSVDARAMPLARRSDIVHSVYYDCSTLGKRLPLVASFHDCIHERFSETGTFRASILARHKRRSVERARFVVAISESSAHDAAEFYGLELERTAVIYPPVSDVFSTYVESLTTPPRPPYFLFVGRRDPYKRWDLLVRAVGLLKNHHPQLRLLSVGGGSLQPAEVDVIDKAGLAHGRHELLTWVRDTDLAALYSRSVSVVCPSLYEGFGYTVAESLCSGGNAIASDGGSLIEFGRVGCQIFQNGNLDSLRQLLENAVDIWASGRQRSENRQAAISAFGVQSFRVNIANLYNEALLSA